MRLILAFQRAVALGILSSSTAFAPFKGVRTRKNALLTRKAGGEDFSSDDMLASLSGGPAQSPKDAEEAFDKVKENMKDIEHTSGGSRFQQLVEATKKAAAQQQQPSAPILYDPTADLSTPSPPTNMENLSVEEQARLFREMMTKPQQPFVNYNPSPPPAPQPVDPNRKSGRNRDADSIANTSDLYFAQLKRDSTVRTVARRSGDLEKANSVFRDDGIKELEGLLRENPHLRGDENNSFLDAGKEDLIAVMKQSAGHSDMSRSQTPVGSSGVSYKQKLMEQRKKRGGNTPEAAVTVPEPAVERESAASGPEPEVEPEPVAATVSEAAAPAVASPPPIAAPNDDDEETRRKIRTLMGLMLKHRGGPGFGAGRLKEAEATKFEGLLKEVTDMLKSEAGVESGDLVEEAPLETIVATDVPPVFTPRAPPAEVTTSSEASPVPIEQRISGMVACIEGAVLMYKNSPPDLQEGVMVTLRLALVSATNTCSEIIAESAVQDVFTPPAPYTGASQVPVEQRIASMLACVEGAVQMYKNSPPNLREGMLVTLRAALMSATNTCNQIIAENEVKNVQAYKETAAISSPSPPIRVGEATSRTSQFYEVAPYEVKRGTSGEKTRSTEKASAEPQSAAKMTGADVNSASLQEVHSALEASMGEEKFGLVHLSPSEAEALADKLQEMKGILVEELDTGIPDAAAAAPGVAVETTASTGGAATSKYQEMLAKAKAEKANIRASA